MACSEKAREATKAWRSKNGLSIDRRYRDKAKSTVKYKVRNLRNTRTRDLKYKYGLTELDYNKMLIEQGSRCGICSRHQTEFDRNLSVDHDHKTGKIRKLLCMQCNQGLGLFREQPELLAKAIDYLKEHQ